MKKIVCVIILLTPVILMAQTRLVLADGFVNITNSAYLVIDNPNATAVTDAGLSGGIISEGEFNRLRWNIGNSSGGYTVPFFDNDGNKIPFTLQITAGGTGTGKIDFSTYDGTSWNNDTYRPSDVTHMASAAGAPNNSDHVIDRFWIADATNYLQKPTVNLTFTYIDNEWSAPGNMINETFLAAQRFNSLLNVWGDYAPAGIANTIPNTVTMVNVAPVDFFRSWTLVDQLVPLPVQLYAFNGTCVSGRSLLSWETEFIAAGSMFRIEKSNDGLVFETIGEVLCATNIQSYTWPDETGTSGAYYRLKIINHDMTETTLSEPVYVPDCDSEEGILVWVSDPETISVAVTKETQEVYTVSVIDQTGRITQTGVLESGNEAKQLHLKGPYATGVYTIVVTGENTQKETKRLYVE